MGVNLFVEGMPSPVVLSIELPREPSSFRDLGEIANALAELETTFRRTWPRTWPSYGRRIRRETWLLRFRVESPVSFEILTDPAWLVVFIAIVTAYKPAKESVQEISADVARLVTEIKGLTERERELLAIAVRLTLDRWLKAGEAEAEKMAIRLRRLRKRLVGVEEGTPSIVVKDVDNRRRPW